MYLSLIQVEQTKKNSVILKNPYKVHQILWNCFSDGERKFLYRTELNPKKWQIYVLSREEPDLNKLKIASIEYLEYQTKAFNPKLKNEMKLKFYLRANPTVKRSGKRYLLVREEDLIDWINRKSDQHGFKMVSEPLMKNKNKYYSFKKKGGRMITHGGIDFAGILEITDSDKFIQTLEKGIGSAKAFGFGLLSIMPL